ncbi:phage holin [Mobilibacterium timonense]|uniref:phage holin n=1 Tax=Mobilibacterium timonense TaxID=1871012 RepID=UPI0009F925C2|nr:phage holin [Mobilibacterium timonense]
MNKGTKIRTILAVATSINTALIATDVTGFNSKMLNTIYTILSIICNFIIVALTTYYNNDFTQAAAQGTEFTRAIKAGVDPLEHVAMGPGTDNDTEEGAE